MRSNGKSVTNENQTCDICLTSSTQSAKTTSRFCVLLLTLISLMVFCNPVSGLQSLSDSPAESNYGNSEIRDFEFKMWTIEDGLPQEYVTSIVQTHDGYIWIGTYGGLTRFDGVTFTVFDVASSPELGGNRILSLLEADNGDLWIGTLYHSVVRLRDGVFTSYRDSENAPESPIWEIAEDSSGALWFGGGNLVRYTDGVFQEFKPDEWDENSADIQNLHVDSNDNLWVALENGIASYRDGTWTYINQNNGLPKGSVRFIGEYPGGLIWAGGEDWFAYLENDRVVSVRDNSIGKIYEAIIDRTGNYWVVGNKGISVYCCEDDFIEDAMSDYSMTNIVHQSVTFPTAVYALMEDREGSIWLGSNALVRACDRQFTSIALPQAGYTYWPVSNKGDVGSFWAMSQSSIKFYSNYSNWTTPPILSEVNKVNSLLSTSDGALWIAHNKNKLSRLKGDQLIDYDHNLGRVFCMLESSGGGIWLASTSGITSFQNEKFSTLTDKQVIPQFNAYPVVLEESLGGALWIGAVETITRYKDGEYIKYTHKDGLPRTEIRSIHETGDGNLWIATYGAGLVRLSDGKFTQYTIKEGLPDNSLGKILEDSDGNLWINSNNGVFRVSQEELNACAEGKLSIVNCFYLHTGEGSGEAGSLLKNGYLWFPTTKNLVMINPEVIKRNVVAPHVIIEQVVAGSLEMETATSITISKEYDDLEIRYTGLSFVEPEAVRFRYILEGYDDDWVEAGTRRTAFYTNVPHGNYKFSVVACNSDGIWSDSNETMNLTLQPYYYETMWFKISCVAGLVGVLVLYLNSRRKQFHQIRKSEELLTLALDATSDGVWDYKHKGCITNRSDQWYELTGYIRGELEQWEKENGSFVHPDDEPVIREAVLSHLAGEASEYRAEFRILHKAGEWRWLLGRGRIMEWDASGKPTRILGTDTDITIHKQAEDARRESESQLRSLFDNSVDAIILSTKSGELTAANPAAHELFGYSPEEMQSINASQLYADPEDRVYAQIELEEKGSIRDAERRMMRKDGTEFDTIISSSLRHAPDGSIIGYQGIIHDISERKRAEEHQKMMMRELDHRVKNNLASISALARLTADSSDSPLAFAKKLDGRIAAMSKVHQILTQRRWEAVEMAELVQIVLSPYDDGEKRVGFTGPHAVIHSAAAQPLAMALHELATNAAKHGALMPDEGTVEVKWCLAESQSVVLEWIEHGKPTTKPDSMGLGLQLVIGFIEKELGGSFTIDFRNDGCVCKMELPAITK